LLPIVTITIIIIIEELAQVLGARRWNWNWNWNWNWSWSWSWSWNWNCCGSWNWSWNQS
jgi:hypothetical protein